MTAGRAALEVEGLTAGHGRVPVVRGLDLHVDAGEIVALLGPNSVGKTTTLHTLCGLLPPLAGQVHAFGHPMGGLRDATRRHMAYVSEHRGLFRQLSVEENLRLRACTRRRVRVAYGRFEALGPLRDRQAGLLSGGEQQLLALACALSVEARLLLIDEMTIELAPMVASHLVDIVQEVAADGVAVLFVEQRLNIALELCDRGYLLSHGECVREGTGQELRDQVDELASLYLAAP